jgi:DNA-binding CsgD family transcriptional regulator
MLGRRKLKPDARPLTPAELTVVRAVARHGSELAAANALHISRHTVHRHLADIRDKTGLRHIGQIVAWAAGQGLLTPPEEKWPDWVICRRALSVLGWVRGDRVLNLGSRVRGIMNKDTIRRRVVGTVVAVLLAGGVASAVIAHPVMVAGWAEKPLNTSIPPNTIVGYSTYYPYGDTDTRTGSHYASKQELWRNVDGAGWTEFSPAYYYSGYGPNGVHHWNVHHQDVYSVDWYTVGYCTAGGTSASAAFGPFLS